MKLYIHHRTNRVIVPKLAILPITGESSSNFNLPLEKSTEKSLSKRSEERTSFRDTKKQHGIILTELDTCI